MKSYLLLFIGVMLLLFALPKNSALRSFAKQTELKKACNYSTRFSKKPCARKCLKHQTHSERKNSGASVAYECSQQVYAIVSSLQAEPQPNFPSELVFILPQARKHLPPDLEHETEPPRLS